MRILKAARAVVPLSMIALGCSAQSPQSSEAPAEVAQGLSAKGDVGASCDTDAQCKAGLVCEPHCPRIPGRPHCAIAGGVCELPCSDSPSSLPGKVFRSADGMRSVTFGEQGAYTKTDGAEVTSGKFSSNGAVITLKGLLGVAGSLSVEAHCYAGLFDRATGVELFPAR